MSEHRPLLRVVSGEPSPEELAALLAVVSSRAAADASAPRSNRPAWNSLDRLVRQPLVPGPGAWRASGLPR